MKRTICMIIAALMLLCAVSCAAEKPAENNAEPQTQPEQQPETQPEQQPESGNTEPEGGEEDGQNPVMNFIGEYSCGRATIRVEAEGADGAAFSVHWGSSYNEAAEWTMSGKLDPDTLKVEYDDCRSAAVTYNDDGSVASETVNYENGKGSFTFNGEDYSLTWQDDEENAAEGMTFVSVYAEPEDSAFYAVATSFDKVIVEAFASDIRSAFLEKDWETLSGMMSYPVVSSMGNFESAEDFLTRMSGAELSDEVFDSFRNESCTDMFANSQGVSMADGCVWFAERDIDGTPMLKIITFM